MLSIAMDSDDLFIVVILLAVLLGLALSLLIVCWLHMWCCPTDSADSKVLITTEISQEQPPPARRLAPVPLSQVSLIVV